MTSKNLATDLAIKTAVNYKPISLTKIQKGADVRPPVVSQPSPEKTVSNSNGSSVEIIRLDLVSVDRTYQRSEKKHAKKIARNFDANAVGHPVINRRPDKSLWAIDGQQRISAMKMKGITEWPCRVVHLKTVEEEAELFGRLNGSEGTQAQVSQRDRFRALVAAKNPHAMACMDALAKGGLSLASQRHAKQGGDDAWREIDCTSFVMGWASVHGYEGLTRIARVVSTAWASNPDGGRFLIFGGIARLIAEFPELDDDRLIAKLRVLPPMRIEQESRAVGTFKASGAVPFLTKIYNKGMKKNKLTVGGADVSGDKATKAEGERAAAVSAIEDTGTHGAD